MPSRKQRRRRQKERRHEYEFVYVDEEGREVEVDPSELARMPRREVRHQVGDQRGDRFDRHPAARDPAVAEVGRYPMQPWQRRPVRPQPVTVAIGLDEAILQDLLGQERIAGDGKRSGIDRALIGREKLLEGVEVS